MTEDEKKLLQAERRLEEAQAGNRVKERKGRTRRLIQKGALVEKYCPDTVGMAMDELDLFLHLSSALLICCTRAAFSMESFGTGQRGFFS